MSSERSGNAYGLTVLSPLLDDSERERSHAALVRSRLQALPTDEDSPMARVPNTYLCRLFVLDNVVYESAPAHLDQLNSSYLVFIAEIHGDPETYLRGMWRHASDMVQRIWELTVGFDGVQDEDAFVRYIKRCQVPTTFYFNGSTDDPVAEQLKSLYLKQELAKFAQEHQGKSAAELQRAFQDFVRRVEPTNVEGPTWRAGASSLDVATRTASATGAR